MAEFSVSSNRDSPMNLSDIPIFNALRAKLSWLSERQQLLSENIANADTPGYQARDIQPLDFESMIKKSAGASGLMITNPRHMRGGDGLNFALKPVKNRAEEVSPTGNSVVMESEMMKMGQTQMEYEAATGLYRKHAQLLKLALGRRE